MSEIDMVIEFIKTFNPETDIDIKYKSYLLTSKIMSGAGIIHLLNGSCIRAPKDTFYLEVGVHRGCTIVGAALNNDLKCIAVDNFAGHNSKQDMMPFNSIREGFEFAVSKNGMDNQIKLHQEGYVEFFNKKYPEYINKISLYMYDGDHSYHNTLNGVLMSTEYLCDHAVVFLDDAHGGMDEGPVQGACAEILKQDSRFSLIRDIKQNGYNDVDGMWNGFIALEFKR